MTKKSLLKLAKRAALAEGAAAASLPAAPLAAPTFETHPQQGFTPLRYQPPRRVQSFAARRRNK
jgi:hypothetical protein